MVVAEAGEAVVEVVAGVALVEEEEVAVRVAKVCTIGLL